MDIDLPKEEVEKNFSVVLIPPDEGMWRFCNKWIQSMMFATREKKNVNIGAGTVITIPVLC